MGLEGTRPVVDDGSIVDHIPDFGAERGSGRMIRGRWFRSWMFGILVVGLVGCGGTEEADAEPESGGGLELGSGELPSSVPDDFPVPEVAVVGATLIDPARGLTEMNLRLPSSAQAATEYFTQNLETRGYTVTAIEPGPNGAADLVATKEDIEVELDIRASAPEISDVVVRIVQ